MFLFVVDDVVVVVAVVVVVVFYGRRVATRRRTRVDGDNADLEPPTRAVRDLSPPSSAIDAELFLVVVAVVVVVVVVVAVVAYSTACEVRRERKWP